MSGIPALLRRYLQRLELGQAASPSSEVAPSEPLPLPALGDFASATVPSAALCARCRRALRRNGHKVRAGRARARAAERDERGRFLPSAVRHAAALALVGWYLTVPYEGKGPHLGNWAFVATFADQGSCEKAAANLRADGYGWSAVDRPDQSDTDSMDRALEIEQKENAACFEFKPN